MLAELTKTKTMTTNQFTALKDACVDSLMNIPLSGSDEVMTWYHYKIIDPDRDGEEDDLDRDNRVDFIPIGQAYYYSKLALLGAIGRGYNNDDTWFINLNRAQNYLLMQGFIDPENDDYPNEPMYLDLDEVWNIEFSDGSWGDCLNYARLLNNVAFIVDMLWYYPGADTTALYNKLSELAGWAYLS